MNPKAVLGSLLLALVTSGCSGDPGPGNASANGNGYLPPAAGEPDYGSMIVGSWEGPGWSSENLVVEFLEDGTCELAKQEHDYETGGMTTDVYEDCTWLATGTQVMPTIAAPWLLQIFFAPDEFGNHYSTPELVGITSTTMMFKAGGASSYGYLDRN